MFFDLGFCLRVGMTLGSTPTWIELTEPRRVAVKSVPPNSLKTLNKHQFYLNPLHRTYTTSTLTKEQSPRATKQLGRGMSAVAPQNSRGGWLPCNQLSFRWTSLSSCTLEWTLISSTNLWMLCKLCPVWLHRGRLYCYLPKTLREMSRIPGGRHCFGSKIVV